MIEIKSLFTDWHEVGEVQARNYVRFLMNNIVRLHGEKKIEYIEKNHLRGITVYELQI